MPDPQFVTREELYDHVWKTPLRKLAADFGVSTHILARICKQLDVPTPAPGYWTRVAFGKNTRRPELPAISDGIPASARIERAPNTAGTIVQKTRLKAPHREVKVPTDLRGCHPLVSATKRALEGVKPGDKNLLHAFGRDVLDVLVSKSTLTRALRLMEALVRAFEREGWTVTAAERGRLTRVGVREDPVDIALVEKVDRFELEEPPEKEKDAWWRPSYRYELTGRLIIKVADEYLDGIRRVWRDGKQQRLEDLLGEIVTGVDAASDRVRTKRLKHEEWERKSREEERRRQQRAILQRTEKDRREELEQQAANFRKAGDIRALIAELKRRPQTEDVTAVERWTAWAEAVAGRFDPFENGYFEKAFRYGALYPELDCEGW